jgi:hypothetical protein
VWRGVANTDLVRRDTAQHGTITVTLYYTVAGGVPSAADVRAAVADLDALYASCPSDRRLAQCPEVTAELTVATMAGVAAKVSTQPYAPAPTGPADNSGGFPSDTGAVVALIGEQNHPTAGAGHTDSILDELFSDPLL